MGAGRLGGSRPASISLRGPPAQGPAGSGRVGEGWGYQVPATPMALLGVVQAPSLRLKQVRVMTPVPVAFLIEKSLVVSETALISNSSLIVAVVMTVTWPAAEPIVRPVLPSCAAVLQRL